MKSFEYTLFISLSTVRVRVYQEVYPTNVCSISCFIHSNRIFRNLPDVTTPGIPAGK
jgi:hypothetical protein